MARFTYKFLKKHTRKLIDRIPYEGVVGDQFLIETLKYHPDWVQKAIKEDGTQRDIRKDRWFADYRLVLLNDDGSVFDDISLDNAIRARTGCVLKRGDSERPVYDPNYYKNK